MGDSSKFQEKQSRREDDEETCEPQILDAKPRGLWQQLDGRAPVQRQQARGMWNMVNDLVQRKESGEPSAADPGAVASAGVQSASERLPHHEQIQASFGRHDVSGIRAQTGGAAAEASRGLGASAYAVGDRVGFAQSPDLHTAAHEAAHVVQQRAGVQLKGGIDGGKGDPYEQHADAVADKVVRGESAEGLLDTTAPQGASTSSGAGVVQRAPAQSQQAPGASITVSLFDKNKAFITSRTEPLYGESAQGSYIGEIQGESIKWDGASIEVKLGSKVEAGGKLSGAMSVGAWARQAGHGRAAYVLVEVDAAQLRTKDVNPDAKPWADDDTTSGMNGARPPATGNGTDPNATSAHTQPGQGGASGGDGGTDDKTVAGARATGDHSGNGALQDGEKDGKRIMGVRSKGEGDGTRHGTKGAQKHDVGYFWDPERQHGGTQDVAPDGADKDGMVGGAGKHGDEGIPDVGAWTAKIPIPKRFAAAASAAMILFQANVQQIAKDLIKAAEKMAADAELKAFALHETEKLTKAELRHLAEKGALEGMDQAALAAAQDSVRARVFSQLEAEVDAEIANAERAASVDRAHLSGENAQYAADDLTDEQKAIAAGSRARSAVASLTKESAVPIEAKPSAPSAAKGVGEHVNEASIDASTKAGPVSESAGSSIRRETMRAPATGKDVEVAASGNAVVPTGKVEIYPRGKSTPFTKEMDSELRGLKAKRQSARKIFDAEPANSKRLDELE